MTVKIDFQSGAHGNYLEFVCNKFIAGIKSAEMPFNSLGASHDKNYQSDKFFEANHYSFLEGLSVVDNAVISIQFKPDDLLPLSMISLLRAGDHDIDNNQLDVNTYHKFNNSHYSCVLDNIVDSFFTNQIKDSYNNVKDDTWPLVNTLDDFNNLPSNIKDECLHVHKLRLLELSENSPDCPIDILYEFFKGSFKYPEQSGFMSKQRQLVYLNNRVFIFPFSAFYNTDMFVDEIKKIACWVDKPITNINELVLLHQEFLKRQPYINSKNKCDAVLDQLFNRDNFQLPALDLMEKSYILANLELKYGIEDLQWTDSAADLYSILPTV